MLEFRSSCSALLTYRGTNTNGSGVNLEGKAAPLTPRSIMLIILPALLLCSSLSTHPLEAGELLLVPRASLFPPRRAQPRTLATWRVTCYFIPAPVEAVDMLRGICVNGFCSISLGFDVGSGFLGWGQAAVFVCSNSPQLTKGEFIISAVTKLIPWNVVSFVCVNRALADQSMMA